MNSGKSNIKVSYNPEDMARKSLPSDRKLLDYENSVDGLFMSTYFSFCRMSML